MRVRVADVGRLQAAPLHLPNPGQSGDSEVRSGVVIGF